LWVIKVDRVKPIALLRFFLENRGFVVELRDTWWRNQSLPLVKPGFEVCEDISRKQVE